MDEVWDLWYPHAGSSGLPFARARLNGDDVRGRLLVHAAPQVLDVTVRSEGGDDIASGRRLKRTQRGPMCWLVRERDAVTLDEGWPSDEDIGRVVLLPGGEAGKLVSWWHADDHSAWRWQVEFYNKR